MNDLFWIVIAVLVGAHLAFGITSARVAREKGHSSELGFLAGILLNVLGLIIMMLMRPSVEAEARRRIEIEREYELQRKFGGAWEEQATSKTEHDGDAVTIRRRFDGETAVLPVIVLSTPEERVRGFSVLADKPAINLLYVWPQDSARERRFLNSTTSLEVSIAAIAADGEIDDLIYLRPRDYARTASPNVISSAIAVRGDRFADWQVDVGDLVEIPEEIRRRAR